MRSFGSSTTHRRPASRPGSPQIRQGSASVMLKQCEQWTIRALRSARASASSRTAATGCFRKWNARRWAVLGPMPGSRSSASSSRETAGGWAATRPLHQAGKLRAEAAGDLGHLARHQLARLPERLVGGGQHEILQHLGVVGGDHLAIDPDGEELLVAVGLYDHHPATGRGLHLLLADLFL